MQPGIAEYFEESRTIRGEAEPTRDLAEYRRELVKAALTGLLSNASYRPPNSQIAREAIVLADLTMKELVKGLEHERMCAEYDCTPIREVRPLRRMD